MTEPLQNKQRLIVVAVLAGAILLALVLASGGGTSLPGSGSSEPTAAVPTAVISTATAAPAENPVQGLVTVSYKHLKGHTWRFLYTVRNTGKTAIAGFQLNGPRANLFHIKGSGWNYFGSGVCGGNNPGLLIYWSTNSAAPDVIRQGQSRQFGFDVNAGTPVTSVYSLSYGTARPQFGKVQAPSGSSLNASGSCR